MNARSVAGRLVFALFQWKRLVILLCVGKKTPIFTEPCCFPAITHPCVPLPYALLGWDCIEGGSPPGHGCLHWRDPQNGISQKTEWKDTHFHKFNTHCSVSQKTEMKGICAFPVHRDAPPCAAPCATALLSCACALHSYLSLGKFFFFFSPRDSLAMIVLGEFSENQVILDVSGGMVSRKASKR